MSDFGFGFDVGGGKKSGGHKGLASHRSAKGHKKHHHHMQQQDQGGGGNGDGGGGGAAPDPDDSGDGGDDSGNGTDDMGWEYGVPRALGDWDLGPSGHRNPMSFEGDRPAGSMCGPSCQCDDCGRNYGGGGDPLVGGYSRSPLGHETGYAACAPQGRNYGGGGDPLVGGYSRYPLGCDPHTKFGIDPMGWEYDGPGYFGNEKVKMSGELSSHPKSFGGDLTMPILSNWGRYPKRSPLVGVFAGDITPPILSNWGRYPKRSPYTGVFAGDITPPILSNWGRYPSRSPYAGVFAADPSTGIHPSSKRRAPVTPSVNAMRFAMRKKRSPFTGSFTGDGSNDIGNEFSAGIGVWRRQHQATCDVMGWDPRVGSMDDMGWETDGMSGFGLEHPHSFGLEHPHSFGLDDDAWASLASAGISAAAGITTAAIASSNRQPVYVAPPAPIGPPAAVTQTLPPSHPVHHRRHRRPLPYFNPPPPPLPDYPPPPPYTYFQPPAYSYTPPPMHTGMPLGYPADTPINYPPPPRVPPPPGVTNQGGTMVFAPDTITAPRPPPDYRNMGYTGPGGSWDPGY